MAHRRGEELRDVDFSRGRKRSADGGLARVGHELVKATRQGDREQPSRIATDDLEAVGDVPR